MTDLVARCSHVRGVVEYNADGIPVRLRWVCRNPTCMPPREGHRALHRLTLFREPGGPEVGTLTREYEPERPLHELVDYLPPERVRRIDRRGQ